MFEPFLDALPIVFQWQNIAAMIGGLVAGIVIGALPGLTATMAIAVLLPLTFTMQPLVALGMMAGIYNGTMYGSAIPAVLLRIPGTPAAVATTFDGYPMAKKGEAGSALQVAVASSSVGGMASGLALMILTPPLSLITLAFGPPEVFWVAVLGLTCVAMLVGDDPLKGIISMLIGLFLATVGIDQVTGYERFTFGSVHMLHGFHIVVVLIGLYAMPPAIQMAEQSIRAGLGGVMPDVGKPARGMLSTMSLWATWLRASVIGIMVGIIPGAGGNVAAFIAYAEVKRNAKDPSSFGKGNPAGVAAAECANNADNAASLIPALTFGIPGSVVAALILGGLLVHGLQPGPQLFREAPDVVYGFMLQMFLTAAMLPIFGGLIATRLFAHALRLPRALLMPIIVAFTVLGCYLIQNSLVDVFLMLGFGVLGYFMERLNIPLAPATLGVILGTLAEWNFRLSLILGRGSPEILYTRPISQVLIVLCLLILLYPVIRAVILRRRAARAETRAE
jgi:putative tricarboxylic transport membrane protein